MDAKYYCETMQPELIAIKARVYTLLREVDKMPASEKQKFASELPEMYGLVDSLAAKLDKLRIECPTEWSTEKEEIDSTRKVLTEKIDIWDAQHIAAGYVGG